MPTRRSPKIRVGRPSKENINNTRVSTGRLAVARKMKRKRSQSAPGRTDDADTVLRPSQEPNEKGSGEEDNAEGGGEVSDEATEPNQGGSTSSPGVSGARIYAQSLPTPTTTSRTKTKAKRMKVRSENDPDVSVSASSQTNSVDRMAVSGCKSSPTSIKSTVSDGRFLNPDPIW